MNSQIQSKFDKPFLQKEITFFFNKFSNPTVRRITDTRQSCSFFKRSSLRDRHLSRNRNAENVENGNGYIQGDNMRFYLWNSILQEIAVEKLNISRLVIFPLTLYLHEDIIIIHTDIVFNN